MNSLERKSNISCRVDNSSRFAREKIIHAQSSPDNEEKVQPAKKTTDAEKFCNLPHQIKFVVQPDEKTVTEESIRFSCDEILAYDPLIH